MATMTTSPPAPPAELQARLAEAAVMVAAVVPVVAQARAVFREAADVAADVAFASSPAPVEFGRCFDGFMVESGAYALGDVLEQLSVLGDLG